MDAQISQTEKTQGDFIMYEHVFIRGKSQKLTEMQEEKVACKPVSAVGGADRIILVCANGYDKI